MLYKSDEDMVYPVSLTDVRAFLALQSDDQTVDAFLTSTIRMVCSRTESMMPFWIAERGISLTVPYDRSIPVKGEIQRLVRVIMTDADGTATDVTEKCGIISTPNGSIIYPPQTDVPAKVSIVFVPEAYVPDAVRLAILTAIRNTYIDRTQDAFTPEVLTILSPYQEANI